LEYAVSTENRDRKAKTGNQTSSFSSKSRNGTRYVNASAIARLSASSVESVSSSSPKIPDGPKGRNITAEDLRRMDVLLQRYGEEFHLAPNVMLGFEEDVKDGDNEDQEARFQARCVYVCV
jgi:hypothetical protein